MPIYNKRFIMKKPGKDLLGSVLGFLKKQLSKGEEVLRFAIVEVKGKDLVIEASILGGKV